MQFFKKQQKEPAERFKPSPWPHSTAASKDQKNICVQVRWHSQQWDKFLLIAALSYVNSLEEKKKSALISVRINI